MKLNITINFFIKYTSNCIPLYLSIYLTVNLTYLPIHQSIFSSINQSIHLSINQSIYLFLSQHVYKFSSLLKLYYENISVKPADLTKPHTHSTLSVCLFFVIINIHVFFVKLLDP